MDCSCQAPLSMGFSRQEDWSGLPCAPPGDLPDPRMEPASLISPALAGRFFITSVTWEDQQHYLQKSKYRGHLSEIRGRAMKKGSEIYKL